MKIVTKNTVLGELNVHLATTFFSRLKGLLFTRGLQPMSCILISPCSSVHTFGMQYSINIIFLNKDNVVIDIKNNIKPNRVCVAPRNTNKVIEMSSKWGYIQSHILGKKFMENDIAWI